MELFELILLLMAAVLASTVVDQLLPRVSLPLVQIAVGAVIVLVMPGHQNFVMNSELFLVLLIAPLLFDESRNADTRAIWENKGSILSLAIGLVLALTLAVGFTLHWLEPSIPLAAAFALGAALGPTDAVAVASLSKEVALSKRQSALLSGEALINDASGVVSFQFAIAAATTGVFSLLDAGVSFFTTFCGGVLVGLVLGLVALAFTRLIRRRGLESVTTHVAFEVLTPFFIFLAAEHFHVSGILAVVAAGLLMSFAPKPINALTTRLSIASSSVWELLVFVANGVVFVMLGMELPQAILPGWNDTDMNNALIITAAIVLALVLVAVRFVWVLVMEALMRSEQTGKRQGLSLAIARDALVTTLAGPKGAVTLSIAFTIPISIGGVVEFPYRTTLICIASVTVLLTLLAANFLMPAVAPKRDDSDDEKAREECAAILQHVMEQLREATTPRNAQAMQVVLHSYDVRLEQLRGPRYSAELLRYLSEQVLEQQRSLAMKAVREGSATKESGQHCVDQIARMARVLARQQGSGRNKRFNPIVSLQLTVRGAIDSLQRARKGEAARQTKRDDLELVVRLEQCALSYLRPFTEMADERHEVAAAASVLLSEHEAALTTLEARLNADPDSTIAMQPVGDLRDQAQRAIEVASDLYARALSLELDEIQRAREDGRITKTVAHQLREEVYLLQMGLNDKRR